MTYEVVLSQFFFDFCGNCLFLASDVPPDTIDVEEQEKEAIENEDPDKRISIMASDKAVHRDNEFYDSGEEDGIGMQVAPKGTKTAKDVHSFRNQAKRARIEESGKGDVTTMDTEESAVSCLSSLWLSPIHF